MSVYDKEHRERVKKYLTYWCNTVLRASGQTIDDLVESLKDGLTLVRLIEVLTEKKIAGINKRPRFTIQKSSNISLALNELEYRGVKVYVCADNFVLGQINALLSFLWILFEHFELRENGKKGRSVILKMCNDRVKNYGIALTNFHRFYESKILFALVDALNPGGFEFANLRTKNIKAIQKALDYGAEGFGIPTYLDADYIVNNKKLDLLIMHLFFLLKKIDANREEKVEKEKKEVPEEPEEQKFEEKESVVLEEPEEQKFEEKESVVPEEPEEQKFEEKEIVVLEESEEQKFKEMESVVLEESEEEHIEEGKIGMKKIEIIKTNLAIEGQTSLAVPGLVKVTDPLDENDRKQTKSPELSKFTITVNFHFKNDKDLEVPKETDCVEACITSGSRDDQTINAFRKQDGSYEATFTLENDKVANIVSSLYLKVNGKVNKSFTLNLGEEAKGGSASEGKEERIEDVSSSIPDARELGEAEEGTAAPSDPIESKQDGLDAKGAPQKKIGTAKEPSVGSRQLLGMLLQQEKGE